MNKITSKIISYKVLTKDKEEMDVPLENTASIAPDSKIIGINSEKVAVNPIRDKIKRESTLQGSTYKIHPANGTDSYYITINNQLVDNILHPIEIFINSKNVEHFQWVTSITRMISAVFRKGGEYDFIVDELSAIHDPIGGYWGKDRITGKGKFYKSLVHEIGDVIAEHLAYIKETNLKASYIVEEHTYVEREVLERREELFNNKIKQPEKSTITLDTLYIEEAVSAFPANATMCKKCSYKSVVILDGCPTCLQCGDSKCG